jgi:hypothetical protein
VTEQEKLALEDEKKDEVKPVEIDPKELETLRSTTEELKSKLQTEMIEKARLEGQVKAPEAPPEAPAPRATREQLQTAVDNGQITQTQMDTEVARQLSEDLETRLTKKFEEKMTLRDQESAVKSQSDSYIAMRPDVKVEGTEDRRRVMEEIESLMKLGYPYDNRTEVLAMRAVFGPIERVPETTRLRRETHQESGGAGGGGEGGRSESKWEKGLTQSQVGIYREQLAKGIYKGEDDPFFLKVVTRARTGNVERKAS